MQDGGFWLIDVSAMAMYDSALVATGGSGPAWLDFDVSGHGYNPFFGTFTLPGVPTRTMFSGVGGTSHYHLPITFGVALPYTLEVDESSSVLEPNMGGALAMTSFVLTNSLGEPIAGQISNVPEPQSAVTLLLGLAGIAVCAAYRCKTA